MNMEKFGVNRKSFKLYIPVKWFPKDTIIETPVKTFIDYIPHWIYHQDWLCKVLTKPVLKGKEWEYEVKKVGHKNILFGIIIKTIMYK